MANGLASSPEGARHDRSRARLYAAAAESTPDEVKRFLDGSDLLAKTQALRLSTVDESGWPHASLLSAGDMLMLPSGRVRFVVFPQSKPAANSCATGGSRVTLSFDGGMCEVRMRARPLAHGAPDVPLTFFEAEVETVRIHKARTPRSPAESRSRCTSRKPCFRAGAGRSRPTEPEENTNPDMYPAPFRLKPEDLPNLLVAPTIPPLTAKEPQSA
jgi:hypothetical protein